MEELNLKIERYEGPLDLLLALIAKNKLNIFDIPIAEIAEQYMAHIEAMRSLNMEVTSEFIYYAAELMLIKSRMLLPREEEEDPRRNLVDALLEYRRARAAAELLRERGELYYDRFTKAPDEIEAAYERPHAVSLLAEAFERIRARLADKPEQGEVELPVFAEAWRVGEVGIGKDGRCALQRTFLVGVGTALGQLHVGVHVTDVGA